MNSVTHPIRPVQAQLISTGQGVRYILLCEWVRLKGLSKSEAAYVTGTRILDVVSANVWASAILGLEKVLFQSLAAPLPTTTIPAVIPGQDFDATWRWSVPDLSPTGTWYLTRMANLCKAISALPKSANWLQDGLARIATQASNFGPDG